MDYMAVIRANNGLIMDYMAVIGCLLPAKGADIAAIRVVIAAKVAALMAANNA